MRAVRGRAEARWLPSRHRFALFRLWAFVRLRRARSEPRPSLLLMVDPDQSAIESYAASTWIWLTTSAYVAHELSRAMPWPLAILAALPLGSLAIQVPIFTLGMLVLPAFQTLSPIQLPRAAINSVVLIVMEIAAASYYAREETWVRFAAWQFLAVIALNAVAATIAFLLRGSIARLEATFECAS